MYFLMYNHLELDSKPAFVYSTDSLQINCVSRAFQSPWPKWQSWFTHRLLRVVNKVRGVVAQAILCPVRSVFYVWWFFRDPVNYNGFSQPHCCAFHSFCCKVEDGSKLRTFVIKASLYKTLPFRISPIRYNLCIMASFPFTIQLIIGLSDDIRTLLLFIDW